MSARRDRHDENIRENVRRGGSCCAPAKTCGGSGNAEGVAKAVGYFDAELVNLPDGANMGLFCGNP